MKKLLLLITFLTDLSCAHAADIYDPKTNQLKIESVLLGQTTYSNVVINVGNVVSVGSGVANGTVDLYNSLNNQLIIPSVNSSIGNYTNVVVTVGSVVSVGGASNVKLPLANGFTVSLWSYRSHGETVNSLTAMKNLTGANSIVVDFQLMTSSLTGNDIRIYQSLTQLTDVLQTAKSLGFDVWFKPLVMVGDVNGLNWQQLAPTDPQLWFNNYTSVLNQIAPILQTQGVSNFLITNELSSMTTHPAYTNYWANLIAALKKNFTGKIGFNAGGLLGGNSSDNEFLNIPKATLSLLDFMGISAYPRLMSAQTYTVDSVLAAWRQDYFKNNDEALVRSFSTSNPSIPLYFTELGNNAYYGGNLSATSSPDPISNKAFVQGSLKEITTNLPKINGTFFYNWTLNTTQGAVTTGGPFNVYSWDYYCKPEMYSVFNSFWTNVLYRQ